MSPTMVSTGEAAKRLGVSPRTIARMIDRGDLPGYRIGSHRRISLDDLVTRAERTTPTRQITHYLGVLLAAAIIEDPERAFATAERNLERQLTDPTQSASWTDRWATLIGERNVSAIVEVLCNPDDRTGMRQTQPFVGLISEAQRKAAFALVRP